MVPLGKGRYELGHDADIVAGTNRLQSDFKEGPQPDFLEDHAFLIRKEVFIKKNYNVVT